MLGRAANLARTQGARPLVRLAQNQRRSMGGGGKWLETNEFGKRGGEFIGTVAWLWIFHRFRQDGAVLLGFKHPWDH